MSIQFFRIENEKPILSYEICNSTFVRIDLRCFMCFAESSAQNQFTRKLAPKIGRNHNVWTFAYPADSRIAIRARNTIE